jgi:hypothetical protein
MHANTSMPEKKMRMLMITRTVGTGCRRRGSGRAAQVRVALSWTRGAGLGVFFSHQHLEVDEHERVADGVYERRE